MNKALLKSSIFFLLFSILILESATAQVYNREGLDYRKWRVSLFPPLSTNGVNSLDYTAKYSINILAGYHGGLDGLEIGTLFNYNKYYSNGVQFAGLANLSGGETSSIGFAGLMNYSADNMNGLHFAGLFNISSDDMSGIGASGLLNYANDDMDGVQFAGIANISTEDMSGVQLSSFLNLAKEDISGIQIAGIANASLGDVNGFQLSGISNAALNGNLSGLQITGGLNFSRDDGDGLFISGISNFSAAALSGLHISGGANIAAKDMDGLMISSITNFSNEDANGLFITGGLNRSKEFNGLAISGLANVSGKMDGVQVSSLLNVSSEATGLQFGLLNFANSFEGMPIGLVSLYGNGRKNVDFRVSDTGFIDYGFTTGTHRVYNMAIVGIHAGLNRNVYRVGWALGLEKNIQDGFERFESDSWFVNQELNVMHHFEENWERDTNLIFSYKYLIGKRFGSGFSAYGGPTFNAQASRVGGSYDYTWYSLWSPTSKGLQYRFWVGITAGVRLFKQKDLPRIDNYRVDYNYDF